MARQVDPTVALGCPLGTSAALQDKPQAVELDESDHEKQIVSVVCFLCCFYLCVSASFSLPETVLQNGQNHLRSLHRCVCGAFGDKM